MSDRAVRNLALFATVFAIVVVILGAFTRLSDAGLGCPDWPGCYGFMHISSQSEHAVEATRAFPEQPYQFDKAWPEMVHRYFAGTLGVLVLILALLCWFKQKRTTVKQSTFLLLLVIFQAALGMWTVTMKLHPLVVLLHLMGGVATLSLLASLTIRYHFNLTSPYQEKSLSIIKRLTLMGLVIVVLQVALGGWTSANYAAMVCIELPVCQGAWLTNSDFISGFQLWGREAETYEYGILDANSRIAIHVAHRIGAIVTTLFVSLLIFHLFNSGLKLVKGFAIIISVLLLAQLVLGINNILMQLPLFNAVLHNATGAILVMTLTCLLTVLRMPEKVGQDHSSFESANSKSIKFKSPNSEMVDSEVSVYE